MTLYDSKTQVLNKSEQTVFFENFGICCYRRMIRVGLNEQSTNDTIITELNETSKYSVGFN